MIMVVKYHRLTKFVQRRNWVQSCVPDPCETVSDRRVYDDSKVWQPKKLGSAGEQPRPVKSKLQKLLSH